MSGENGHSNGRLNGSANGKTPGGLGEPAPKRDPNYHRADVRDHVRAITGGWLDNDQEKLESAVATLHDMATTSTDDRVRVAAAAGLVKVVEFGQRVAEFDDKTNRLDTGGATERHEYVVGLPEVR